MNDAKIFIVDDHPLVREWLTNLIKQHPGFVVCGEAATAAEAVSGITTTKPDVAIVDISLRNGSGLDLIKTMKVMHPDTAIIVLSMHDEALYAERALRARANGYIMKQEAPDKVLVALRRIFKGDVYLSDNMSKRMLQQYIDGAPSVLQSRITTLSDRELEVFRLIGEGRATREIAEELHLSIKTVETYQAHIKDKLSLRSGRELIQHAMQWRIQEKAS